MEFEELMAEGYKAMAKGHLQFAEEAIKIAREVLPEWNNNVVLTEDSATLEEQDDRTEVRKR